MCSGEVIAIIRVDLWRPRTGRVPVRLGTGPKVEDWCTARRLFPRGSIPAQGCYAARQGRSLRLDEPHRAAEVADLTSAHLDNRIPSAARLRVNKNSCRPHRGSRLKPWLAILLVFAHVDPRSRDHRAALASTDARCANSGAASISVYLNSAHSGRIRSSGVRCRQSAP
jgi:hypothetical protein